MIERALLTQYRAVTKSVYFVYVNRFSEEFPVTLIIKRKCIFYLLDVKLLKLKPSFNNLTDTQSHEAINRYVFSRTYETFLVSFVQN